MAHEMGADWGQNVFGVGGGGASLVDGGPTELPH